MNCTFGGNVVLAAENYQDIEDQDLKEVENVYVTAGASTPPILIDEVIEYLSSKSFD